MKKTKLLEEFTMQQVCQFLSYHIDMDIIELRFAEKRSFDYRLTGVNPGNGETFL